MEADEEVPLVPVAVSLSLETQFLRAIDLMMQFVRQTISRPQQSFSPVDTRTIRRVCRPRHRPMKLRISQQLSWIGTFWVSFDF
jgi:hypothetical protein